MKRTSSLSAKTREWLFALLSFLVCLTVYFAYLLAERFLGTGTAYLWFLMFVPVLFVLYAFGMGFWVYKRTKTFSFLFSQWLSLLAALVLFIAVDFLGKPVENVTFSMFVPDLSALVTLPILQLCGARAARFVLRRKHTCK